MMPIMDNQPTSPRPPFPYQAPSTTPPNAAAAITATFAGSHGTTPLPISASSVAAGSGLAGRTPHSRNGSSHTHSGIGLALNSTHRINRRRSSMNGSSATNVAAVAAAVQERPELLQTGRLSSSPSSAASMAAARRSAMFKTGVNYSMGSPLGSYQPGHAMAAVMSGNIGGQPLPSPPPSMPSRNFVTADGSAIDDELNDMSDGEMDSSHLTAGQGSSAARRVSDGRRSSRVELRCHKCGKSYKHSSCLNKHKWEHTPEWALTSQLLISKHQQVQLLEAASVLVNMNAKSDPEASADSPPESSRASYSDDDAPHFDDMNSVATTPPPAYADSAMHVDADAATKPEPWSPVMPLSSIQTRSAGFGGLGEPLSASRLAGHSCQRHGSHDGPLRDVNGREDRELVQAVGMLSCSANSPGAHVHGAVDVPPVSLEPHQYVGQTLSDTHASSMMSLGYTAYAPSFRSGARESFTRGDHRRLSAVDSRQGGSVGGSVMGEGDEDCMSRGRSDDDEDGVFGRMEE